MPNQAKLITLNVERSKHMRLILPFLEKEKPDILCTQEVMEHDLQKISAVVGGDFIFEAMNIDKKREGEVPGPQGVAIFSRFPMIRRGTFYYHGDEKTIHTFDGGRNAETNRHMLLVADIDAGGAPWAVGTTHSPVTPKGPADEIQRRDIRILLDILEKQGAILFCGDFNAARPGEIYKEIAVRFLDHMPPHYIMSLDTDIHRAGKETLAKNAEAMGVPGQMVDYIFSTPEYAVSNVRMQSGVSDHCAVIATVSKNS
jgi:endonuclease/exonuclease/phosphatase family metal-dependent hydrolase